MVTDSVSCRMSPSRSWPPAVASSCLASRDQSPVAREAELMRIRAGNHGCCGRLTNRALTPDVANEDPLTGESVQVWRLHDGVAHGTQRVKPMLVGEDQENVGGLEQAMSPVDTGAPIVR